MRRLGLAQGEAKYDDQEAKLATAPVIICRMRRRKLSQAVIDVDNL
jgi:hypothetical protein